MSAVPGVAFAFSLYSHSLQKV